jgi:hypothetical protein
MYEIRILENEEFDQLPYKHSKTALGMADAKTGVAYVRKTGIAGLDANTIRHEFDELLQTVSPHEEDGIRYKSGGSLGKWLAPVLGFALAPFTGGLTIPVLAGGALAAGTGAHSRSVKPEKYGQNTFGSVLTDAAVGGLGAYGGGTAGLGFQQGFSQGTGGLFSKIGQGLKGAVGLPTTGKAGTIAAPATAASQTAPASGLGARFAQGAVPQTGAQLASRAGGSALSAGGISQAALTAGASKAINTAGPSLLAKFGTGASNLAKQGAQSLAVNSVISSLAPTQARPTVGLGGQGGGQPGNALSLFGTQPRKATGAEFTAPYGETDVQKGLSNIHSQYDKQYRSIFDTFRQAQPGASIEGNTAFARQLAQAKQGLGSTVDDFYSGINKANEDAYTQYRYDGVKNTNNLSDSQMREYIRLAQQPDSVIRGRFPGMTPKAFKDIFSGLEGLA